METLYSLESFLVCRALDQIYGCDLLYCTFAPPYWTGKVGSTSGVDEEENKRMSKVKRLDPVPESKRKKKREDRDKGKVWRRKKEKKKKRNVWIKKIREKK